MTKTTKNLEAAFAGESQASRKYHHFAVQADKDGFTQVAKLFRAAALAETIHAGNHLKALGGVNTTRENLQAAIKGENYEVNVMYPEFLTESEAEGEKKATTSFRWAFEVEKGHEELYKKALENLDGAQAEVTYYVCPICGHTHVGKPTDRCPVCGTAADKFILVD